MKKSKKYVETTQCLTIEVTYIDQYKTEEELKKMLKADNVKIKSDKRFEHDISDFKANQKCKTDPFFNFDNKFNGGKE